MKSENHALLSGCTTAIPARLAEYVQEQYESIPTPLYLYDEEELALTVDRFRALFPEPIRVFYSLKANPQPAIIRRLAALGVGAELASDGERRAVDISGIDWRIVLAGGVAKSLDYLRELSERDPLAVVVDSPAEWRRLKTVALETGWAPDILLRINPGESTGGLDMAGESQFGMEVSNALILAEEIQQTDCARFKGLHFYFGSQRLISQPIIKTIAIAGEIVGKFKAANYAPDVVDIGLGCGVPYLARDEELDLEDLTTNISAELSRDVWSGVELWTEAGRALVATSCIFVSRVIERKSLHKKEFAMLDGGVNVHNPGIGLGRFFRSNPRLAFATKETNQVLSSIDIVGNLCTSADCLARNVEAPDLRERDLVLIPNSGAYCQTTGFWGFNSQPLCSEAVLTKTGEFKILEPQHMLLQR